jgi:hypothetical protein
MTTKARLDKVNGIVIETLTADPFPPFAAAMLWVECPANTPQGAACDGLNFISCPGNQYDWNGNQWILNAARQAALDAAAADVADTAAANAYAKLASLRNMTPAQVQTWVDANVVDLPSAKDAIKTLAIAVSICARRFK